LYCRFYQCFTVYRPFHVIRHNHNELYIIRCFRFTLHPCVPETDKADTSVALPTYDDILMLLFSDSCRKLCGVVIDLSFLLCMRCLYSKSPLRVTDCQHQPWCLKSPLGTQRLAGSSTTNSILWPNRHLENREPYWHTAADNGRNLQVVKES
jgi:hypothetical protein